MKTITAVMVIAGLIAGVVSTAEAQSVVLSMKGPGSGNPFWAAVERGASVRAKELGVELTVLSPPTESDVASQVAQIDEYLAKGIDGLVLAPTDPTALAPLVDKAIKDDVPVVFIDTMGSNEGIPFIGTNNVLGAALAAQFICGNVEPRSDVALITGIVTQSTGRGRANGGRLGLEDCGLNVVAEQSGEWDRDKGRAVMESILAAHPGLTAVFASNDNMALGAVDALKAADKLKDVLVVGFDANPDAARSIIAGELAASVAQNPFDMGALGVESVLKLATDQMLPPIIDTGTLLVTARNAARFQ